MAARKTSSTTTKAKAKAAPKRAAKPAAVEAPPKTSPPRKGKSLVIVESPAKAKTIGKYLGPDFDVTASKGHVRDLPKKDFGIDIEGGWTPTYKPLTDRKDVLTALKKQVAKAGMVYLAPDPDREGEAI